MCHHCENSKGRGVENEKANFRIHDICTCPRRRYPRGGPGIPRWSNDAATESNNSRRNRSDSHVKFRAATKMTEIKMATGSVAG